MASTDMYRPSLVWLSRISRPSSLYGNLISNRPRHLFATLRRTRSNVTVILYPHAVPYYSWQTMCHTTGLSYQILCEDDLWHPMTRTWQFASPMTSGGWTGVRPLLRERFNILAPWQCWLKIDENFWKASKCFKENEVTIDYRIPAGLGLEDCRSAVATLRRHQNTPAHSSKNDISWMRSILFMMTCVLVAQWFTMIFAYFFQIFDSWFYEMNHVGGCEWELSCPMLI